MDIWWSPGQSKPTRKVLGHLAWRQKAVLLGLSGFFGVLCFTTAAILFGTLAGTGPFQQQLSGLTFPIVVVLGILAFAVLRLQQHYLLNTSAAKYTGLTRSELSKENSTSSVDTRRLIGFAAVAVAVMAVAVLVAFIQHSAAI